MWGSKCAAVAKNLTALHQFLVPFDILPFDYNATIEYGIIRAELETKGTPIGPLDTLIAAHAKSVNHILVTNNNKEFSRVSGLQTENWVI
ncbi:MAG: PIN domain-containing protein [Agriterribacter sp.]